MDGSVLEEFKARNARIHTARLTWVDYRAVQHVRIYSLAALIDMLKTGRKIVVSPTLLEMHGHDYPGYMRPTSYHAGQAFLEPDIPDDPTRFVRSADNGTHIVIPCFLNQQDPTSISRRLHTGISEAAVPCPRSLLRRAIAETDLIFSIGIKFEFYVKAASEIDDVHSAKRLRLSQRNVLKLLDEVTRILLVTVGIGVHGYRPSRNDNQYAFSLSPMPPAEAADAYLQVRDLIDKVFSDHGLEVDINPCQTVASEMHINLSIANPGEKTADSFLAGMLEHTDALFAFGQPDDSCYRHIVSSMSEKRVGRSSKSYGHWNAWGTHNRAVPYRAKGDAWWEIRYADAHSNLPLLFAGLIFAGVDGVKNNLELKVKDTQIDPQLVLSKQHAAHGITQQLPSKPLVALDRAVKDKLFIEKFGKPMLETYQAVLATTPLRRLEVLLQ